MTSFNLETSYWTLQCPDYGQPDQYDDNYWMENMAKNVSENCGYMSCTVTDWPFADGSKGNGILANWGWAVSNTNENDMAKRREANTTEKVPKMQVFYRSSNFGTTGNLFTAANCTIATTYVEAGLNCNGWDCKVDRLRRSKKRETYPSTAYTIFDSGWRASMSSFLTNLVDTADNQLKESGTPGLLQEYIADPTKPFSGGQFKDLRDVGNETFAMRFSQLLNTYWSTAYNFNLTYGDLKFTKPFS
ncbi:uncharacterized protein F4822DRAFT_431197 [Hypoxylon trugodes]|uniref:uncharacterized protein n=1 Tax=Hypoxylon trugodes TaxID=326681 RepID=UPI00219A915F|nr:uncharacterized protein F4822DRAFT_431197 [Hypoxylon trugodes]KAI1386326.1 hypothetical protein F4822DRAFT_431197 [Hypoxylon trugodes]